MQFTQRSIPCRFGLGLSTAFYRLGLSTVSKLVRFFCWVGARAIIGSNANRSVEVSL